MNSINRPILMNRNFRDWILFLFFVLNVVVVLNSPLSYFVYLNVFAAGLCFSIWLFAGIINTLQGQVEHLIKLCGRSIKLLQHDVLQKNERRKK